MCLGIPGEVISIEENGEQMRRAKVRFGGITRDVYLDLVPEAQVGDYVIVHVGFAISKVNAEEAERVFELLSQLEGDDALPG
ncbi:MAG: HypC/HybG/HupF family hydrogenase formation chaperone [Dehalococcoidia bacterium]|nr:HypC/HybG/HupF family hydrogenase formation chaperone [Dehalococcoidia bacterium]